MKQRYILLPEGGIRSSGPVADVLRRTFDLGREKRPMELASLAAKPFAMLDSVNETGPKLVELEAADAEAINRSPVPLRALPEIIYRLPDPLPRPSPVRPLAAPAAPAAAAVSFTVRCEDAVSGAALPGLTVVAFDNFAAGTRDQGTTDALGEVRLTLSSRTIDRLYVLPSGTHWGAFRSALPIVNPLVIGIEALSAGYADAIRQFYPTRRFAAGTGVRVGVLDTGVGPHGDLNVAGGRNTVTGGNAAAYADIDIHGTHVAGLIGGNGRTGLATLGLAPGVPIHGYRVFDFHGGQLGASNYAILKAMILAAADGCDIINLSLGGGPWDAIVAEAVRDAREQGMLVVVAAGNDGRAAVSYPAAHPGATAVSAMGLDHGFPAGSYFAGEVLRPPLGTNAADYIADFSNVGLQIACTGLGSGVLSTLPGNRFGPLSGTSMAAPMVAGAAASLLSQNTAVYGMPRNIARSAAIERLLQSSCRQHFGGGAWEGYGLPDPGLV